MYRKKDKKVMIIAAAVVIAVLAAIYIVPGIFSGFGSKQATEETEVKEYEVLIHKTDAGKIDVKKSWLKSDGDSETKLSIEPGTLVSINVTPAENKVLESVQVVDAKDFTNEISSIMSETKTNTYTIDFSMPESDVIMNFHFETVETDEQPETTPTETPAEEESESESESETEEGNPYGLTLHGITADLITSFNGQFDDRDFCQQLGDSLRLDSPMSEYYGITDVTFSQEAYTGDKDSDKVYTYIYFNEDPDWKMFATYYLKDKSYVFTVYAEPETEDPEDENAAAADNGDASGSNTNTYSSSATGGTGYSTTIPGKTTSTSFDILQVSKNFLDFTGDQDKFYSKAFDYVLSKGLTGSITGTMSSYKIDAENQKATIDIKLSTGGSFTATYDKSKDAYSFKGL